MNNNVENQKEKSLLINEVWNRIKENEGQVFQQIRGGEFTYQIKGSVLYLSRTNRSLNKNVLSEALKHVPLKNTVPLQNLQAPSYLYALLTDSRIKGEQW